MLLRIPVQQDYQVHSCKLCGGEPVFDDKIEPLSVHCQKCFARGPVCSHGPDAVRGWNKLMEPS